MSTLLLIFLCFVAILTGIFITVSPGMPEYFLAEKYATGLEDYFTVCL